MCDESNVTQELEAKRSASWFHRMVANWLIDPVKKQLSKGTSKEKVALAMALSPVLSAFPILGTTNLLSIIVGYILRLNIPFLLVFKTIFYPLHIGLILVFIRIGESMNHVDHIPFSIPELLMKFKDDPRQFAIDFGMTALYGVQAWALITPWFTIVFYYLCLYLLKKYEKRRSKSC